MSEKTIVLAPPYSGTLYAYFHDCHEGKNAHLSFMDHSYYERLYGQYSERNRDVALTLSILYDTIKMPPADAHPPESGLGFDDGHDSWDDYVDYRNSQEEAVKILLRDPVISSMMLGQDEWEKENLLEELGYCLHLSEQMKCPIFCGEGTKRILDRICAIQNKGASESTENKVNFVGNYLNLYCLSFDAPDMDSFATIKHDASIRDYSRKFISILEKKSDSIQTEAEMKYLIQRAIQTNQVYQQATNILNIMSYSFTILGLPLGVIPSVGTGLGFASAATGTLGLGMSRMAKRWEPDWYELARKIETVPKDEWLRQNGLLKK